jgi:hypothetical protein
MLCQAPFATVVFCIRWNQRMLYARHPAQAETALVARTMHRPVWHTQACTVQGTDLNQAHLLCWRLLPRRMRCRLPMLCRWVISGNSPYLGGKGRGPSRRGSWCEVGNNDAVVMLHWSAWCSDRHGWVSWSLPHIYLMGLYHKQKQARSCTLSNRVCSGVLLLVERVKEIKAVAGMCAFIALGSCCMPGTQFDLVQLADHKQREHWQHQKPVINSAGRNQHEGRHHATTSK